MDPVRNPFAPGAGTPPPELAGRRDIIELGTTALRRTALGRPNRGVIMHGLRGVGKTVLLTRLNDVALAEGFRTVSVEAREGKALAEMLVPGLRTVLYSLSGVDGARELARRALRALKGFLNGLKVNIHDVELGLSIDGEPGLADTGLLEADLPDLIVAIGEAARAARRPVALLMDELQYLTPPEFSALIMSLHRINQNGLPVVLIGAGLPQILGLAGNSKSYSERLFQFPEIGALSTAEATQAIDKPARDEGARFTPGAIDKILAVTERYPYFLQQFAYEAWNVAPTEVIDAEVVDDAHVLAIAELDRSFFKVRFDRCTPSERKYMRALADLGQGKHRSGDIAERLQVKVTSVAPTRGALIRKGMIYAPSHGDTAFTVPLFSQYMVRQMPLIRAGDDDE